MTFDVAVIGLGGIGSSVAAACAERGLSTVGIERFAPSHHRGSSHGQTRLIRETYYAHQSYVPLVRRSFEKWRELERETSEALLTISGALYIGKSEASSIAGVRASAQSNGIALIEVDEQSRRRRFPTLRIRSDEAVLFEPGAGYIHPESAVRAFTERAIGFGARLMYGAHVADTSARDEQRVCRITLLDGTVISAGAIVLCLGPWLTNALAALFPDVYASRVVQAWFEPARDGFETNAFPSFSIERAELPGILYGFPDSGRGVKAAFHNSGKRTDPDALDTTVTSEETGAIASALDDVMPGAAGKLRAASACMYTMTPDEHFILGSIPERPGVFVAGGCSGHGFKFCPVLGEIVADLVEHGTTRYDIGLFSPTRFQERSPLC